MPIQLDLDDSDSDRLASYFEEIYIQLHEAGVPEDRLPSPWHVLSHIVQCVDYAALREWIDGYSALEGEELDDREYIAVETEERSLGPSMKRPRPSYLRPLPNTEEGPEEAPESADGE
jgi:hypothetical protein